jgi:flavin-binding protein dodecin
MFYKLYGTIITVFMLSVVGCASAQPMDQTKDLAAVAKSEADTCEQPRVGTSKECHDKFQAAIEATKDAYKTRTKEALAKMVTMVHDLRVRYTTAQQMDQTKDLAAMTKYEADTCEQPRVGTSKECHDKFQAAIEATDKAYKTRAKEDWAKLVRMVHDLRVQYTMAQKPPDSNGK